MVSWSEPTKITEGVAAVMRFLRRRQWEEIAIVLGVASIWVGCSFAGWLTDDLKKRLEAGQALMLIQAALVIAGALSFGYGAARSWRLVSRAEEPPVTIRPSAIKGPDAFTEADGGLFSKLGREKELRQLLHHVLNDQTAMIILLGASGAGKTSLLRAGLTHALVGSGVRYHYWEAVPSDSCERLLRTLQVTWSAGGTEPGQSTRSLAALGELINPAPELCRVPHVIVIDQFEQLRADNPLFDLLRKVARDARPPHRVTWVIAFRGDFRASWSDFIVPEQDRGFYPKELPLQLFTPSQARAAIVQLLADAAINIEHAVVDRLIEATTVDGKVSPVDIGVGLLVVAELHERHAGKTLTERDYHFAGGAEGLLTQYVERCLSRFPDRDRPTLLKTLLALQDPRTEQRLTEGLTATQLGQRLEEDATVLGRQLQRLAQRDMRLVEPLEQAKEATPYRLPHERMIAPLRRLAGSMLAELDQAQLRFERAFLSWKSNDQRRRYLLTGPELRQIERAAHQLPWNTLHQAERQTFLRQSRRQRRAYRAAGLVATLLALVTLFFVRWQNQRSENRRYLAERYYPPELLDWQHRLTKLKLDSPLDLNRFAWFSSDSVKVLSLRASDATDSLSALMSVSDGRSLEELALDLRGSRITDLGLLRHMRKVRALKLDLGNTGIRDLKGIEALTELTSLTLDLERVDVTDLGPLRQLRHLRSLTLTLTRSDVTDLGPLADLTALDSLSLDLSDTRVSNLSVLSRLTTLSALELDTRHSEVNELSALPKLERLATLHWRLSHASASNSNVLGELANLDSLYLGAEGFDPPYLCPLERLGKLRNLRLHLRASVTSRPTVDLRCLARLHDLEVLSLDLRGVSADLAPLGELRALSSATFVLDDDIELTPIGKLERLTTLDLTVPWKNENQRGDPERASDLQALEHLGNLTSLKLKLGFGGKNLASLKQLTQLASVVIDFGRGAGDLAALEKLPSLTMLDLALGFGTIDLVPLQRMANLKELQLNFGFKCTWNMSLLTQLRGLNALGLNLGYCMITDLTPVGALGGLKNLNVELISDPDPETDGGVTDLSALTSLTGLQSLGLKGRAGTVQDLSPLGSLSGLRTLSITGATDPQRKTLRNLGEGLTELTL